MKYVFITLCFLLPKISLAQMTVHNFITVKENKDRTPIECDKMAILKNELLDLGLTIKSLRERRSLALEQNNRELALQLFSEMETAQKKEQQRNLLMEAFKAKSVSFELLIKPTGFASFMIRDSTSLFKDDNEKTYLEDTLLPPVIPKVASIVTSFKGISIREHEPLMPREQFNYPNAPTYFVGNMSQGDFCQSLEAAPYDVAQINLVYEFADQKITVANHITWNKDPLAANMADNSESLRVVVNEKISPWIVDVFGESDLFMVDDRILEPLTHGRSKVIATVKDKTPVLINGVKTRLGDIIETTVDLRYESSANNLREALQIAKETLNRSKALNNPDILALAQKADFYTVYRNGQLGAKLTNGPDVVEVIFARGLNRIYVERVLVNQKEVFLTGTHMIKTNPQSRLSPNYMPINPRVKDSVFPFPKPKIIDWDKVRKEKNIGISPGWKG